MKKIIFNPQTIKELPQAQTREIIVDFHARFPLPLMARLERASKKTGYLRNDIVKKALEAFLK